MSTAVTFVVPGIVSRKKMTELLQRIGRYFAITHIKNNAPEVHDIQHLSHNFAIFDTNVRCANDEDWVKEEVNKKPAFSFFSRFKHVPPTQQD